MTLIAEVKDFLKLDNYHRAERSNKLDLLGVAEAHILWKTQLGHYVQGHIRMPPESPSVGQDGICQLGNWIKGSEFEQFRELPEFHQLREAHCQFHQSGEIVMNNLRSGDLHTAGEVFRKEYSQSLRDIIKALTGLSKHLQQS